jgi:hypothetical protein
MNRQCIALNSLTNMLLKSHRICMGLRKHMHVSYQVEQYGEWTGVSPRVSVIVSVSIFYSRHAMEVTLKRPDVTEMYIQSSRAPYVHHGMTSSFAPVSAESSP